MQPSLGPRSSPVPSAGVLDVNLKRSSGSEQTCNFRAQAPNQMGAVPPPLPETRLPRCAQARRLESEHRARPPERVCENKRVVEQFSPRGAEASPGFPHPDSRLLPWQLIPSKEAVPRAPAAREREGGKEKGNWKIN